MGNLIKLGIAKIGLVKQKGLVLSVGLVKKIVEYDYYQWLFARKSTDIKGADDDVNNYGTGGNNTDFLKIFNQPPVQVGNNWGYLNEINAFGNYDLNIIIYANSIGAQDGVIDMYKWVSKLKYQLEKYHGITAVTVNASTTGITGLQLLDNYATELQPNYDPAKRNIVIGFEVINDLGAGATDQECYEHLRDISALVQADGHEFILATALNTTRTANNENTRIPIINQICKDNPNDWNAIWDMNQITQLIDPSDTLYFGDGTHPTNLGAKYQSIEGAEFIAVNYLGIPTENVIVNKTSALNVNENNAKVQISRSASWDFGAGSFTCFATFRVKDVVAIPRFTGVVTWRDTDPLHSFAFQANYLGDGTLSIQSKIAAEDGAIYLSPTYIAEKNEIIRLVITVDRDNNLMTNYFEFLKREKDITGISGSVTPTINDLYIGGFNYGGSTGNIDLFHVALINGVATQNQIDEYLFQDKFNIINPAFNLDFEHHTGAEVLDNGIDKLTGTILNDTFSTWIQEAGIEPKSLTKGCTVYTDGSTFRIVNYDNLGNPQNRTIAGFTKVGDFPTDSGFLKGLSNTIDFPDTTQVNDYLTAKGITRTDQSFDDIFSYSSKGVALTKNVNQIQLLTFIDSSTGVNVDSFNQVLTSDGSLVITFDIAPTIDDYNGTATPTVNGNTIEVSAGQLYDITINGELFPLVETKGTDIWGVLGTKATLNTDVGVWDNLNENAVNWLFILGGELYVNDITPTDKIRVIKGTNGFITPTITGYTKTEQHNANAGVWDSGSEYLNQVNSGLETVFNQYGLPLKNSDGNWDYDTLKSFNGYPYPNNLKQLFLKPNEPIFDGNELKDYSNTPVNSGRYERCYDSSLASEIASKNLKNNINYDWATDGIKFEFITSIRDNTRISRITSEVGATSAQGIRINTDGTVLIYFERSTSPFYVGHQFTISTALPVDNTLKRLKFETISGVLYYSITDVYDDDYSNAITESVVLSTLTDIVTIAVCNGVRTINGLMSYANLVGHKFYFCGMGDSAYVLSTTTDNYLDKCYIYNTNWQNEYLVLSSGYTRLYFNLTGISNRLRTIIPYINSQSIVNDVINTALVGENTSFEEFTNSEFGRGWAFKLNSSIYPDGDGVYFNGNNTPLPITVKEQPTAFNSRIFYDRLNNSDIKLYNVDIDIKSPINFVGEEWGVFGDSVANAWWNSLLQDKIGGTLETYSYGGQNTASVLTNIKAAVASDPTMISRKKAIFHITGFNDYRDVTPAKLIADFSETRDYYRSQNPTATIFWLTIYKWSLDSGVSIDDGETVGGGGLTMNSIISIAENQASLNENEYSIPLYNAGIVLEDIPDDLHIYSNTGSKKAVDVVFSKVNIVTEGTVSSPIPESDYRQTVSPDGTEIYDIAVQPYVQHFDVNGNPLYTVDGKERWVLKSF